MKYTTKFDGDERCFQIERHAGVLTARIGDKTFGLDLALVGDGATFSLFVDGRSYDVVADVQREQVTVQMLGEQFVVHVEDERERAAHAVAGHKKGGKRELRAAMPGIVVDVKVAVGDNAAEGQTLVVLEAMKMQNELASDADGIVDRILVSAGDSVAGGAVLVTLKPEPSP